MKLSTLTALCTIAAPLSLASNLDMDLRSRGLLSSQKKDSIIITEPQISETSSQQKGTSNSIMQPAKANQAPQPLGNNNAGIKSITTTSATEIILIWVNPGNNAATTTVNSVAAGSTAVGTAAAPAATHTVVVGGTTKVYTPNTIQAAVGDMVLFQFQAQNHTVTQSSFAEPCVALARGMDSGFMPNLNGTVSPPPQVAMMVKVETPLWFYCRQANHCGEGMTFSINPTANKTQAAFEALAIAQNGTGSAAGIVASAPAAPGVSASSSSNTGGAIVSGQGTLDTSGACVCAVQCGVGSFPDVAVQGVAAFGGMQGQVPAKAVEVTA